jgi:pimeloyl-ACP methyl ester carboxylesterase
VITTWASGLWLGTVSRVSTPAFLSLPDGVRARRLPTSRGGFAALEAGPRDGPLVVLVPGWTGSKEDYIAVLAPLAEAGYHALALDQRGQYETPGTGREADYTLPALAADLAAVAEHSADPGLGIHLVGHSFGGLVARSAVLGHPELAASLTLLCSGPAAIPADRQPLLQAMADAIPAVGLQATWEAKRAYELSRGAPVVPHEIERFLERRFLSNDPVSLRAMTQHLVSAPDEVEALAAAGVPTLVAFGDTDDGWPTDVQVDMARRLGARLAVIERAGHSPAVERPRETVATLVTFWAAISRPASRVP